jgi:vitamin B12 transporter
VQHTAGFEICSLASTDCFGNPPDHDGFLNRSGSFAAGVQLGDDWKASVDSLVTSGHTDYDGTFSDSTAFAERVTSLHVDGRLAGTWSLHALAGRDVDDAHDFLAGSPAERFETRRNSASLQLDGSVVPALRAVVGSDWYGDHIGAYEVFGGAVSPVQFERTTRDTTGTFLELHGATGAWTELAGVRLEHDSQYGDHVTEDFGVGWNLDSHLRLSATWGTAFHAPTFNDLYYPSFPGFPPPSNPRLRPEVSRSLELGVDGRWGALQGSLHVYQTDVRNLITDAPPDYTPINLDAARIRGVELQGRWHRGRWTLSGQVTALDPVDRSRRSAGNSATRGNLLSRRAQSSAFLDVRRAFGKSSSLAVRGRWQGRRFDDLANTIPLGGYFVLDALAEARIGAGWSLEGRIANALGRRYHTAANVNPLNPLTYYNQPGRELDLTVRYRFRSVSTR